MTTKEFNLLFLNIYDDLEITIESFYYKIIKQEGRKMFDYGYNKGNEKGWKACPKIRGKYCGSRNYQNGELDVIKIHVTSFPFKMTKFTNGYLDYITLGPSAITGIDIIKKTKPRGLDEINHKLNYALNVSKDISKN